MAGLLPLLLTAALLALAAAVPPPVVPEDCVSWSDGCNTCGRDLQGSFSICTKRQCLMAGTPSCLQCASSADASQKCTEAGGKWYMATCECRFCTSKIMCAEPSCVPPRDGCRYLPVERDECGCAQGCGEQVCDVDPCAAVKCAVPLKECATGTRLQTIAAPAGQCCPTYTCVPDCKDALCSQIKCQLGWTAVKTPRSIGECCDTYSCVMVRRRLPLDILANASQSYS